LAKRPSAARGRSTIRSTISFECPPQAIFDDKQWVRGEHKWYVDFDKWVPCFNEARGCGVCLAACPWSKPGVSESLTVKMLRKRERAERANA
jgi:hypothetical protein